MEGLFGQYLGSSWATLFLVFGLCESILLPPGPWPDNLLFFLVGTGPLLAQSGVATAPRISTSAPLATPPGGIQELVRQAAKSFCLSREKKKITESGIRMHFFSALHSAKQIQFPRYFRHLGGGDDEFRTEAQWENLGHTYSTLHEQEA